MFFNKKLALNVLLCVVIIVAFILNMFLLCSDIFNGTYSATLPTGGNVIIKFYDNTFTYIEEKNGQYETYSVGFYKYFDVNKIEKSTSSKDMEDIISLILSSDDNYFTKTMTFQRKSVFCISKKYYYNNNDYDVSFYCTTAIFLQVLYIILEILAIIILIIYNRRNRRKTENVISSTNV